MEITDDLGVYMEEDNNMDIEGGWGAWVLGEPSTFFGAETVTDRGAFAIGTFAPPYFGMASSPILG